MCPPPLHKSVRAVEFTENEWCAENINSTREHVFLIGYIHALLCIFLIYSSIIWLFSKSLKCINGKGNIRGRRKNLLTLFIYLLSLVIKDAKGKTLKQTHTLILRLTHMTYKITIYDNLLFSKCLKDPNFCFYISCSQDGTNISCRA